MIHATVGFVLLLLAAAMLSAAGLTPAPPVAAPPPPGLFPPPPVATGQWPVDPARITRAYLPPSVRWGAGHRGVDLAAVSGQPVHSMASGVVSFVGVIGGIPVVAVRYPGVDHRRSTYQPVIASVVFGQGVEQGAAIGTVAPSGGHCGGIHHCLHVGLRTDTAYLDPGLLVGRVTAVLKPQVRGRAHPIYSPSARPGDRRGEARAALGLRTLVQRRARVRLGERRPQPLDGHVGVPLRRRQ